MLAVVRGHWRRLVLVDGGHRKNALTERALAGRGGKQDELLVVPPSGGSAPTGQDRPAQGKYSTAWLLGRIR